MSTATTTVVLFTADLRLHDHPPLRAALDAGAETVPLFVVDSGVERAGFASPNRRAFLADCLADLDAGLRERGGRLVVRTGEVVEQVCRVVAECGAAEVHVAAGVSGYAAGRERRLRRELEGAGCRLVVHDAVLTALPPGAVTPGGSDRADHYAVFTPYHRRWAEVPLRDPLQAPRTVRVPEAVGSDPLPSREAVDGAAPELARGGEAEGRRMLENWVRGPVDRYPDTRDQPARDGTSRLSPHLHFGTVSAVEAVHRAARRGGDGAEGFVRQLCWRDFNHQLLAARPDAAWDDLRSRGDAWRSEKEAAAEVRAWREGRTGYPLVDAGMRQLLRQGWMHNRVRMVVASLLCKTLYADWRIGARHFLEHLVDGDLANNQLNWQWVAGTGADTRPNRVLNPVAQGRRWDPDGDYVRHWVPELAGVQGAAVHEPWKLPGLERAACDDYPDPVVDLSDGLARFRAGRGVG